MTQEKKEGEKEKGGRRVFNVKSKVGSHTMR